MTLRWVVSSGMVEVKFDALLDATDQIIRVKIEGKEYKFLRSQIDFRPWSSIIEVPEWIAKREKLI
jgi:hypothetical protein